MELLKLGGIGKLKPKQHVLKLMNDTEVQIIGSIELNANYKSRSLLFYVANLEMPSIVIGVDGLNKIFPNW